MSHHHMLTPIVYTPEVKPKKIEPKKPRIRIGAAGSVDEADGETFEVAGPKVLQNFAPIEGADEKPHQPRGRLSEGTLKAMLQAQEFEA